MASNITELINKDEEIAELQEEIDALTVAQNQKCADCTLVKELSKKNADLMSKLSIRTAEISKLKEDIQQCIQN
jgi:predicted RNase H-like nuclease (RuvC/YqgF family)